MCLSHAVVFSGGFTLPEIFQRSPPFMVRLHHLVSSRQSIAGWARKNEENTISSLFQVRPNVFIKQYPITNCSLICCWDQNICEFCIMSPKSETHGPNELRIIWSLSAGDKCQTTAFPNLILLTLQQNRQIFFLIMINSKTHKMLNLFYHWVKQKCM